MPGCSERRVALAVVAVLKAQLDSEASERAGGATAHVKAMCEVHAHCLSCALTYKLYTINGITVYHVLLNETSSSRSLHVLAATFRLSVLLFKCAVCCAPHVCERLYYCLCLLAQ